MLGSVKQGMIVGGSLKTTQSQLVQVQSVLYVVLQASMQPHMVEDAMSTQQTHVTQCR